MLIFNFAEDSFVLTEMKLACFFNRLEGCQEKERELKVNREKLLQKRD